MPRRCRVRQRVLSRVPATGRALLKQALSGNTEASMQALNHAQSQRTLPAQHLVNAVALSDHRR